MSKSLNKCIVIGRLVRDPESRAMPDGTATTSFTLAVDDDYKGKDGTKVERAEFVPIEGTGKVAEICNTYLVKGKQVMIEGMFSTRSWDKDGEKRYKSVIKIENMQMLGSREDGQAAPARNEKPRAGYRNSPGYQPAATGGHHPPQGSAWDDDDIPM